VATNLKVHSGDYDLFRLGYCTSGYRQQMMNRMSG